MKKITLCRLANLLIDYGKQKKEVSFLNVRDGCEYTGEIFAVSGTPVLLLENWDGEKTTVFSQPISANVHTEVIFTDVYKFLEANLPDGQVFLNEDFAEDIDDPYDILGSMQAAS